MRRALSFLIAALAALGGTTAAHADGAGGGAGGGEIWAGVQTGRPPHGVDGTDTSACRWRPTVPRDAIIGEQGPVLRTVGGTVYQLFDRVCPSGTTLRWIPRLPPADVAMHAASLLRARLPPPRPGFAPEADRAVTRVGTWFWIDPTDWRPRSVTAWVPTPSGPLWATTTARPVRLVLDPGDGALGTGAVACPGPGTPWRPADGDTTRSRCMYTYDHASVMHPSGRFPARIAIEWMISWTSSTGAGGGLPGHTTWTQQPITVDEIQALVTS